MPEIARQSVPATSPRAAALLLAVALLGPPRLGAENAALADRAGLAFASQAWSAALPLFDQLVREQPSTRRAQGATADQAEVSWLSKPSPKRKP